jgi:hypothetical protein
MRLWFVLILVLVLATSALAWEKKAYQMKEDFGTEPLQTCDLQYYYFIPCPTYSWFWAFSGWSCGDVIGEVFYIGDAPTGDRLYCDPYDCQEIYEFRVLDFAGYGTVYPGLFTVEFCIWCADPTDHNPKGHPFHSPLWCSGPWETHFGWNWIDLVPPICLTQCCTESSPPGFPVFLITARHIGTSCQYPAWGADNISTALDQGCIMHDIGCMPALYPRPWVSHYPVIHSGYYGSSYDFEYCPPLLFLDGRDTTPDGTQFGYVELAWTVWLNCHGPTATEPSTWGNIKSIYR